MSRKREWQGVIVGAGDVALRLAAQTEYTRRWRGLARSAARADGLRQAGILPVAGDLDQRRSLRRAAALARSGRGWAYLAPPPAMGPDDVRMRHWLAALVAYRPRRFVYRLRAAPACRRARPLRPVYVSTTGVYGDCGDAWIDETRPLRPQSSRALRRQAAERRFRRAGVRGLGGAVLRAPGIYAAERLPVQRLQAGTPLPLAAEDGYSNHIHADDLARALWLALFRGRPGRAVNVVDAGELRMGEWFDQVADRLGLPRPPRLPRAQLAQVLSPAMLSFLDESRRIGNHRLRTELRLRLRYPTPQVFLQQLRPVAALQRTLF